MSGSSATMTSALSSTHQHDVAGIRAGSPGGVLAIICTHGHDDHVRVCAAARGRSGGLILLHLDEAIVWALTHPGTEPDGRPGTAR